MTPLLTVSDLKTYYFSKGKQVKAVDGISFDVQKGQSLGIAGESGCGKSTVALSLMRLIKGGKIVGGKICLDDVSLLDMPLKEFNAVRWEKIAIILQAAMGALNPVYRIGTQIVEAIVAHRNISKKDAWRTAEILLTQVELDPSKAMNYPHELSGGMRQRAMIAMALALDPKIVIADEPTTALDVVTQAQILGLLKKLQRELHLSFIFISHDLSVLAQTVDRLMIMYAGKAVEIGDAAAIFTDARHPYTKALLAAFPDIKGGKKGLTSLKGAPPNLIEPPTGCRFHPRCPVAETICAEREPLMQEQQSGHIAACHLLSERREKSSIEHLTTR